MHPLIPPAVDAAVFGAKMLIDDQIMAKNLNSRWRPYAILDFQKPDFWPIGRLRVLIFRLSTKFGAKILIDAEIMAKKEIQDGGRPPSWIFEKLISDK